MSTRTTLSTATSHTSTPSCVITTSRTTTDTTTSTTDNITTITTRTTTASHTSTPSCVASLNSSDFAACDSALHRRTSEPRSPTSALHRPRLARASDGSSRNVVDPEDKNISRKGLEHPRPWIWLRASSGFESVVLSKTSQRVVRAHSDRAQPEHHLPLRVADAEPAQHAGAAAGARGVARRRRGSPRRRRGDRRRPGAVGLGAVGVPGGGGGTAATADDHRWAGAAVAGGVLRGGVAAVRRATGADCRRARRRQGGRARLVLQPAPETQATHEPLVGRVSLRRFIYRDSWTTTKTLKRLRNWDDATSSMSRR